METIKAPPYDLDQSLFMEWAVEQLPNREKHIIILKYYEDYTIAEIAQVLNRPEGTVKTWLHHALNRLRNMLKEEGVHYVLK